MFYATEGDTKHFSCYKEEKPNDEQKQVHFG